MTDELVDRALVIVANNIDAWGWGPISEIEGLAEHDLAVKACAAGLAAVTPQIEAQGAKAMQSNEGPQPIPVRYTCEGCVHFSEEYWKDYIDNDETDSGHTAKCAKADRTITHYWSTNQAPPSWCPIAALDPAQIVKDKP